MNRTFIMRECLGKALWLCFCLSITGCAEDDRMTPLSADSGDTADELIPIHISLTGDNDYHSSSFNDASTPENVPEYSEAYRLRKFLRYFVPMADDEIPPTSLLREFVGGSSFHY